MNTRFDMMLPRRQTILGGVALAAGAAAPARAQLTIDMTRPSFEPVPIAIVDFKGDRGADIAGVVRNDLQNSGLFRSIAPSAFIQQNMDPNAPPRLRRNWVRAPCHLKVGRTNLSAWTSPSAAPPRRSQFSIAPRWHR